MRAPSAARSLSYAAKPSWTSYQALQSQYVCDKAVIPAGRTLNLHQTVSPYLPVAPVQHDP